MKTLELTKTQLYLLKGLINKITTNDNGNRELNHLYYEFTPKAPDVLHNINKKLKAL